MIQVSQIQWLIFSNLTCTESSQTVPRNGKVYQVFDNSLLDAMDQILTNALWDTRAR